MKVKIKYSSAYRESPGALEVFETIKGVHGRCGFAQAGSGYALVVETLSQASIKDEWHLCCLMLCRTAADKKEYLSWLKHNVLKITVDEELFWINLELEEEDPLFCATNGFSLLGE